VAYFGLFTSEFFDMSEQFSIHHFEFLIIGHVLKEFLILRLSKLFLEKILQILKILLTLNRQTKRFLKLIYDIFSYLSSISFAVFVKLGETMFDLFFFVTVGHAVAFRRAW
jgi:hypothetical protein